MKYSGNISGRQNQGRSREGAWIEISSLSSRAVKISVAPARERGLKFQLTNRCNTRFGRSREGAWIEIAPSMSDNGAGAGSLPRGSVD